MIFITDEVKEPIKPSLDKNREVKALPKYFSLIAILQVSILLIPESLWKHLGFDAFKYLDHFPRFVQYYVQTAYFHNAMFIFWVVCPFTLVVNTYLFTRKVNTGDYTAFLERRKRILQKQGKSWSSGLVASSLILLFFYIWLTFIDLNPLESFPRNEPTQNRFAMLIIHGGFLALALPVMLSFLITEIRAILNNK